MTLPQSAIATLPGAPIVNVWGDTASEALTPTHEPWQPTTLAGHLATDLVDSLIAGRNFRVRVLRVALRLALKLRRVFG
jgi:hypothetical protein